MAIKVQGTTVIDDSKNVTDVELKKYSETAYSLGALTTNTNIDISNGPVQHGSIGASLTFTFSAPGTGSKTMLLRLYMNGNYIITWPASVKWPNATAPTLTSGTTNYIIFNTTNDGTAWYGNAVTGYI